MADRKPTLASRLFAGGGSAGLLGDPLFQVGMGLLAKGQDNRIPYATAVMQGLQGAQTARDQATRRQMLAEQARREKIKREAYENYVKQLFPNVAGEMAAQPVPNAAGTGMQTQMMGPPVPQEDPRASLLTAMGPEAGAGLLASQAMQNQKLPGSRGAMFSALQNLDPNSAQYAFLYNELNKPTQRPGPGGVMEVVPGNPLVGIPAPGTRMETKAAQPAQTQPTKILPPEARKLRQGLRANISAYNNYVQKVQEIGRPTSPTEFRELNAAFQNLLLEAKELYNLGVLQGPDQAILEEVTPSLTSFRGYVEGGDAAIKQLQAALLPKLQDAISGFEEDYGETIKQAPLEFNLSSEDEFELNAETARLYKDRTAQEGDDFYRSDGKQWIKVDQ